MPKTIAKEIETSELVCYIAGVGKLFTRTARIGKTDEAAGRTLIGKQEFFFGDHSQRANVISKIKDFHLVFHSNFAPLRLIFLKITAIHDLQTKRKFSAQFTMGV